MRMALFLYLARIGLAGTIAPTSLVVPVNEQISTSAAPAILQPYMSYSIEFCYFPDYAGMSAYFFSPYILRLTLKADWQGNRSQPNTFSNQLLDNLGDIQGMKPYIRVGGNTQYGSLYHPNRRLVRANA